MYYLVLRREMTLCYWQLLIVAAPAPEVRKCEQKAEIPLFFRSPQAAS